jgi:hypothetical protein
MESPASEDSALSDSARSRPCTLRDDLFILKVVGAYFGTDIQSRYGSAEPKSDRLPPVASRTAFSSARLPRCPASDREPAAPSSLRALTRGQGFASTLLRTKVKN